MTAFPTRLPDDLDDLASIADNDWAAFQALEQMDTHWQRPGWVNGRRSYHWMVTFEDSTELARHVVRCQQLVPTSGFDLVAEDSVHLTVGRVGFADKIPVHVALAVRECALRSVSRPSAFELVIGPLSASRGAVRFSVGPWTPLLALHAFLAAATREVLGDQCVMDTDTFRPHVGIAYAHTRTPVQEIVAALSGGRGSGGPRVPVKSVSLVELERVDRSYRYRPLGRVPLQKRAQRAGL